MLSVSRLLLLACLLSVGCTGVRYCDPCATRHPQLALPPPQVALPASRFHPVPTRPAFEPQADELSAQ